MSFEVFVTDPAFLNLQSYYKWWSVNRSDEQAVRWREAFLERIYSLEQMPSSHPLARENGKVPFELREMHFGLGSTATHRAVFRIEASAVHVLAVRHVAQHEIDPAELT